MAREDCRRAWEAPTLPTELRPPDAGGAIAHRLGARAGGWGIPSAGAHDAVDQADERAFRAVEVRRGLELDRLVLGEHAAAGVAPHRRGHAGAPVRLHLDVERRPGRAEE